MALQSTGVGANGLLAGANAPGGPSEEFGNDERVEALWAIKAMEHSEVYFNILCSVDPSQIPRLSPCDDDIYAAFRREFPDMKVARLGETKDLKSEEVKKKWRGFCESFKHVEDYSFATLVRLDSEGEYEESNSSLVTKIQFYAIELARNREGLNNSIRNKFKPKPRAKRAAAAQPASSGEPPSLLSASFGKEVELELQQILSGRHSLQQ